VSHKSKEKTSWACTKS